MLEAIHLGMTKDEVAQRMGSPQEDSSWMYEGPGDTWVIVSFDSGAVAFISFGNVMTLGQFIETFGEPSAVYRSTYRDVHEDGPRFQLTELFYDQPYDGGFLHATIEQGLCEFPSGIVVDHFYLDRTAESLELTLSDVSVQFSVELEWLGLAD